MIYNYKQNRFWGSLRPSQVHHIFFFFASLTRKIFPSAVGGCPSRPETIRHRNGNSQLWMGQWPLYSRIYIINNGLSCVIFETNTW
jgi:hypothetical protein